MRRATTSSIGASLVLMIGGCSETVTHRENVATPFGKVELIITSVGSALDGERYELKYRNGSKDQTFFTGWSFSEFKPEERDGKFLIQMCTGWIEHAEPILIRGGESLRLVRLNIDWNCLDKRHEA